MAIQLSGFEVVSCESSSLLANQVRGALRSPNKMNNSKSYRTCQIPESAYCGHFSDPLVI